MPIHEYFRMDASPKGAAEICCSPPTVVYTAAAIRTP
jgi:hypothetical protein